MRTVVFMDNKTHNKSIKFASKRRWLDAAPKTRNATYFERYDYEQN
jgi:hypothetical protein